MVAASALAITSTANASFVMFLDDTSTVGIDKIIARDFQIVKGHLFALRVGSFNHIFTTLSKEDYGDDYKALNYKSGALRNMFELKRTSIGGHDTGYKYLQ